MNINRILAQAQGYVRLGVMGRSVFENMRVEIWGLGLRPDLREKAENALSKIFHEAQASDCFSEGGCP